MSSSLEGRVAVVFGVANKRSIAWSIAQGLHQAGAKLAVTYQNQRLEMEAKDLILSLPGAEAFMCDVSDDAAIELRQGDKHGEVGRTGQRDLWTVAADGRDLVVKVGAGVQDEDRTSTANVCGAPAQGAVVVTGQQ